MTIRRTEAPILAAVFLGLLGFGMIIADIQLRAEKMVPRGWPPGLVIGILLAATFVIQLFASPWWGSYSDHHGRKWVVVGCTAISGVAMLTYGVAGSIWILLLSRILAGLGAANVAVGQALISDMYEPDQRTAALGRIGAALSAGLVVGPAIGGFLAASGGNFLVGTVAGSASLGGAFWMLVGLPNPVSREKGSRSKITGLNLRLLQEMPKLRPLVTIAIVAWFALATLEGTFARLISHLFQYDQRHFGVIFGYESILGVSIQGLLLAWFVNRVSSTKLLRGAYFIQGIGLALNPFAGLLMPLVVPFVLLIVASTLYSLGSSIANPTVNGLCSRLVPDDRQGELFGLLQGARSIGFVVGPLAGGALFDWHPAAPYVIAGSVSLVAAVLVPRISA